MNETKENARASSSPEAKGERRGRVSALRLHAIRTITIKRITEILVSPGFYVTFTAALLVSCYLITDFVAIVGSDGVNPAKSQGYGLVYNLLKGVFGEQFTNRLMSQGPFIFSLSISFFAFAIYCGMSTVLQFGNEKGSGALEVIASGPADETSSILGYFAVNMLSSACFLLAITIVNCIAAAIANLNVSAEYFSYLLFLILGSGVFYAYCGLASVVTRSAFAGLACFMLFLVLFAGVQFGMYGTVSETGNIIAGSVSYVLQWISPFFPLNIGGEATEYGSVILFIASVLVPLSVSTAVLLGSHLVSRKHGVRI